MIYLWILFIAINLLVLLNYSDSKVLDPEEAKLCTKFEFPENYEFYETFLSAGNVIEQELLRNIDDAEIKIKFAVKSYRGTYVVLSSETFTDRYPDNLPAYEFVIGGGINTYTALFQGIDGPVLADALTPGILSPIEFRVFYIRIVNDGTIELGNEGEAPLISYKAEKPIPINYYSFTRWKKVNTTILYDCPAFWDFKESDNDINKYPEGGFCDGHGEIGVNDLANDIEKMKCRVCECNLIHGWKCLDSHQACYNHYGKNPVCKVDEVKNICKAHCQPTCWDPYPVCEPICVSGCTCDSNLVRDIHGNCILQAECRREEKAIGIICDDSQNEEYNICGKQCEQSCSDLSDNFKNDCKDSCVPGCTCKRGYARDEFNRCIPDYKCPLIMGCSSFTNETYDKCGESCDRHCGDDDRICNEFACEPGCTCLPGYKRSTSTDTCVQIEYCNAEDDETAFSEEEDEEEENIPIAINLQLTI